MSIKKWIIGNNILKSVLGGSAESVVWRNNMFLSQSRSLLDELYGHVLQNNIFLINEELCWHSYGLIYFSNIFNFKKGKDICGDDMGGNVYIEQPLFVKYQPNSDIYQCDFHLRPEIAKLKGLDGTERGIYGGRFPFEW